MSFACPPLLRFALHLLLALATLLQASTALAMHASSSASGASESADQAAALVDGHSDLPPCHAAVAADFEDAGVPADCCGDTALGESCRWACAQALGVTLPLVFQAARPPAAGPLAAPILPVLRWTAQSPLRPPIG